MTTRYQRENDGDDDFDGNVDGDETIPCPYCGAAMHEESVQCPHCGNYLSDEDRPHERKPLWLILAAIACLLAALAWIFF
jgi:predicted nucleic acid-binding Zn ribbon protein